MKGIKCSMKPGMRAKALRMDVICILEGKLNVTRSAPS